MPRSTVTGQAIPGQSGVTLLLRIVGQNGSPITVGSVASITYIVSDITNGAVLGAGVWLPASTVINNLVTGDPRWTIDTPQSPGPDGASGYNFLATLPAALFPIRTAAAWDMLDGYEPKGVRYQADVAFVPVSGEPFRVVCTWREEPVRG